jgi:hypothetical protein
MTAISFLLFFCLSAKKENSAGYRLIYLPESEISIFLLTIYNKAEKEDITVGDINSILGEYLIGELKGRSLLNRISCDYSCWIWEDDIGFTLIGITKRCFGRR